MVDISISTQNCDINNSHIIEESADSVIEIKLQFDKIVSAQSKKLIKDELCQKIQNELSKFNWICTGNINLQLMWYLDDIKRQETDSIGDLDNISKPILDSLIGYEGVLIDDSQISSLDISWISKNPVAPKNCLRLFIYFNNDYVIKKDNLIFIQYSDAICLPVNVNFNNPKDIISALILVYSRLEYRATANSFQDLGINLDHIFIKSAFDFHRTRLNQFLKMKNIYTLVDFEQKCLDSGLINVNADKLNLTRLLELCKEL